MSRIPIDQIVAPAAEYRIRRGRTPALSDFDHRRDKLAEDRLRKKLIRGQASRDRRRHHQLRQLERRIGQATRRQARSLASSVHMRDLRKRVTGQLWALVARTLNLDPRFVTLFPRGWEIPSSELHRFNPRQRLSAVRSLINRHGGNRADGYLIACIHGEFEPGRQVYQLHLHMIAAGGLRDVLDRVVRHSPTARSVRNGYGVTDFVRQRLQISGPLTNLPAPLTYLVKGYWPSRPQYRNAAGKLRRSRRVTRIAEPHHTEVLLWLDRWQLSDLTLLMNLSVGRDGFVLSDRAYTNGDI